MIALDVDYGACTDDPETYEMPPEGYQACDTLTKETDL
jgi:hypothetical protein